MHPASNSVKYFGLYVIATGVGLVFAPGLVLSPLGIAMPTEIWIRVVGAISIPLGYYYWVCGSAEAQARRSRRPRAVLGCYQATEA
jgi:hypothetical protein